MAEMKISNTLVNDTQEGVIAYAQLIKDTNLNQKQSAVNSDLYAKYANLKSSGIWNSDLNRKVAFSTTIYNAENYQRDTIYFSHADSDTTNLQNYRIFVNGKDYSGVKEVTIGNTNGTICVDNLDVKVKGLNDLAYMPIENFVDNFIAPIVGQSGDTKDSSSIAGAKLYADYVGSTKLPKPLNPSEGKFAEFDSNGNITDSNYSYASFATLNNGKVPLAQLPDDLNDVMEVQGAFYFHEELYIPKDENGQFDLTKDMPVYFRNDNIVNKRISYMSDDPQYLAFPLELVSSTKVYLYKISSNHTSWIPTEASQGKIYIVTNLNNRLFRYNGNELVELARSPQSTDDLSEGNNKYVTQEQKDSWVKGPSTASTGRVAVFDNNSGQLIKDSGFTIGQSVPSSSSGNILGTTELYHYLPMYDNGTPGTVPALDGTMPPVVEKYNYNTKYLISSILADTKGHLLGYKVKSLSIDDIENAQSIDNLVTGWSTSPKDFLYPSEKLVKLEIDTLRSTTTTLNNNITTIGNLVTAAQEAAEQANSNLYAILGTLDSLTGDIGEAAAILEEIADLKTNKADKTEISTITSGLNGKTNKPQDATEDNIVAFNDSNDLKDSGISTTSIALKDDVVDTQYDDVTCSYEDTIEDINMLISETSSQIRTFSIIAGNKIKIEMANNVPIYIIDTNNNILAHSLSSNLEWINNTDNTITIKIGTVSSSSQELCDVTTYSYIGTENAIKNLKSLINKKYELPSAGLPYSDLSDDIKNAIIQAGQYVVPSGGIPMLDLSSSVLESIWFGTYAHMRITGGYIAVGNLSSEVQASLSNADYSYSMLGTLNDAVATKITAVDVAILDVSERGDILPDDASACKFNYMGHPVNSKAVFYNDTGHVIVCAPISTESYIYYDFNGKSLEAIYNTAIDTIPSWIEDLFFDNYVEQVKSAYQLPSSGVPIGDLSQDITTSLSKADSALQESYEIVDILTLTDYTPSASGWPSGVYIIPDNLYTTINTIWEAKKIPVLQFALSNHTAAYAVPLYKNNTDDFWGHTKGYNGDYSVNISISTLGSSKVITEGIGKYNKPSGGIPSTDMTATVQASLNLANTAYLKPLGGIPIEDLDSELYLDITSISNKVNKIADSAIMVGNLTTVSATGGIEQSNATYASGILTVEDGIKVVNNTSKIEALKIPLSTGSTSIITRGTGDSMQIGDPAVSNLDLVADDVQVNGKSINKFDELKANIDALLDCINTNCINTLGGVLSRSTQATEDSNGNRVYEFTFTAIS